MLYYLRDGRCATVTASVFRSLMTMKIPLNLDEMSVVRFERAIQYANDQIQKYEEQKVDQRAPRVRKFVEDRCHRQVNETKLEIVTSQRELVTQMMIFQAWKDRVVNKRKKTAVAMKKTYQS